MKSKTSSFVKYIAEALKPSTPLVNARELIFDAAKLYQPKNIVGKSDADLLRAIMFISVRKKQHRQLPLLLLEKYKTIKSKDLLTEEEKMIVETNLKEILSNRKVVEEYSTYFGIQLNTSEHNIDSIKNIQDIVFDDAKKKELLDLLDKEPERRHKLFKIFVKSRGYAFTGIPRELLESIMGKYWDKVKDNSHIKKEETLEKEKKAEPKEETMITTKDEEENKDKKKNRHKEKERDKEKDKNKEKGRDKEKDKEKDKDKGKEKDRDKENDKNKEKDKYRHKSERKSKNNEEDSLLPIYCNKEVLSRVKFIDTEEKLEGIRGILTDPVVALDCEWRPRGPAEVSIIQMNSLNYSAIIDLIALKKSSKTDAFLSNLLISRDIRKVGHAFMENDHKVLNRSFFSLGYCMIQNFVDTMSLNEVIEGTSEISLKRMTSMYLKKNLKKDHQRSNWADRPLSESQIEYAIYDVAAVYDLYNMLIGRVGENIEKIIVNLK